MNKPIIDMGLNRPYKLSREESLRSQLYIAQLALEKIKLGTGNLQEIAIRAIDEIKQEGLLNE